uniref:Uncharacterized protein n=1 Tax=Physcomitrium patens TaxID=3218 RepID=A9RX13_PHYPA
MAPLGDENDVWLGNADSGMQGKSSDSFSIRVSNNAQENFKRPPTVAAGEPDIDWEDVNTGCCFFRRRSIRHEVFSGGPNSAGTPFARLGTEDPESTKVKSKDLFRSSSIGAVIFCCCAPRERANYTVAVRSVDATKQDKTWTVDVNEEYSKPPYWKRLIRKLKAQAHGRPGGHHHSRCEWLNYDLQNYQMNFDDGCWREICVSSGHADESDGPAERARAMHSAFLQKYCASRTLRDSQGSPRSPMNSCGGLSPLPVKMLSKEELEKSKKGFVPIWQRRQGAPPIKLDLRPHQV